MSLGLLVRTQTLTTNEIIGVLSRQKDVPNIFIVVLQLYLW